MGIGGHTLNCKESAEDFLLTLKTGEEIVIMQGLKSANNRFYKMRK